MKLAINKPRELRKGEIKKELTTTIPETLKPFLDYNDRKQKLNIIGTRLKAYDLSIDKRVAGVINKYVNDYVKVDSERERIFNYNFNGKKRSELFLFIRKNPKYSKNEIKRLVENINSDISKAIQSVKNSRQYKMYEAGYELILSTILRKDSNGGFGHIESYQKFSAIGYLVKEGALIKTKYYTNGVLEMDFAMSKDLEIRVHTPIATAVKRGGNFGEQKIREELIPLIQSTIKGNPLQEDKRRVSIKAMFLRNGADPKELKVFDN